MNKHVWNALLGMSMIASAASASAATGFAYCSCQTIRGESNLVGVSSDGTQVHLGGPYSGPGKFWKDSAGANQDCENARIQHPECMGGQLDISRVMEAPNVVSTITVKVEVPNEGREISLDEMRKTVAKVIGKSASDSLSDELVASAYQTLVSSAKNLRK